MASIHVRAPLVLAAGAVLPPVCTGLVALRFYARRIQNANYGIDDWLTLPVLITVIGACIAILIGAAQRAIGYPTPPTPPDKNILTTSSYEQTLTRSVLWATEVMQVPGLTCVKASFIFFYRRVFLKGSGKPFELMTLGTLAVVLAWGVAFFFSLLFICPSHPSAFWTTLAEQKEHCLNSLRWHDVYGITDVVLDIVIFVLPMPQVIRLQMPLSRKLAILGVFSLGALSILASMLRMITYLQSTKIEFDPNTDTDILITGAIYWSVLESGVALISCCLPTAHSFTRRKLHSNDSNANSNHGLSRRRSVRRSMLARQGYNTHQQAASSSTDRFELTKMGQQSSRSSARAGGEPALSERTSDENILVTRTLEVKEESGYRNSSMV